MRHITKSYYVNEIPVIEIIDANLEDKAAPLSIFYHGFTGSKDSSMTFGNEIAKRGFRVIMPDAQHHGERRKYGVDLNVNGILFFEALMSNVKEFPEIVHFYRSKELIKDDFIAVAGMSMGGMTTSLILKANKEVNVAVVLMGSPQQIKFNDWIVNQYVSHGGEVDQLAPNAKTIYEYMTEYFKKYDLGLDPKAINQRPLLFWHSKQDPVVPYIYAEEFVEAAKNIPEGKYVYLKLDDQGAHKVPFIEMARMGEFISAAYNEEVENVYEVAEENFNKLWG